MSCLQPYQQLLSSLFRAYAMKFTCSLIVSSQIITMYRCGRCFYTGSKTGVQAHWLEEHCSVESVPYLCRGCSRRFRGFLGARRHLKSCHPAGHVPVRQAFSGTHRDVKEAEMMQPALIETGKRKRSASTDHPTPTRLANIPLPLGPAPRQNVHDLDGASSPVQSVVAEPEECFSAPATPQPVSSASGSGASCAVPPYLALCTEPRIHAEGAPVTPLTCQPRSSVCGNRSNISTTTSWNSQPQLTTWE